MEAIQKILFPVIERFSEVKILEQPHIVGTQQSPSENLVWLSPDRNKVILIILDYG